MSQCGRWCSSAVKVAGCIQLHACHVRCNAASQQQERPFELVAMAIHTREPAKQEKQTCASERTMYVAENIIVAHSGMKPLMAMSASTVTGMQWASLIKWYRLLVENNPNHSADATNMARCTPPGHCTVDEVVVKEYARVRPERQPSA